MIAGGPLLGAECTSGDPVKDVESSSRVESDYVLDPEQYLDAR